jgi:choline kinase
MGTRLKPFTENFPKALVKVNGKPFLEYQLKMLNNYRINKLIVVIGYKGEQIRSYFEKKSLNFEVIFVENKDFSSTGCAWSLMKGLNKIQGKFIYMNSDLLLANSAFDTLVNNKMENVILVRSLHKAQTTILQKVEAIKDRVVRMDLTLEGDFNYEAVGPLKISENAHKSLWKLFHSMNKNIQRSIRCYSLFGHLAKIEMINIRCITDDLWVEINTPKDLKIANIKIASFK